MSHQQQLTYSWEWNFAREQGEPMMAMVMRRVTLIKFRDNFFFLSIWIHKWLIDRRIFHRTRPGKQGALIFNSFNNTVALPECHGQWPWDQEFKFYADSPTLPFVPYCPEFLGHSGVTKRRGKNNSICLSPVASTLKLRFWKTSIYIFVKRGRWPVAYKNEIHCYLFSLEFYPPSKGILNIFTKLSS